MRGLRLRDWGIPYAPDWSSVAVVLRLHNLWTPDVQDRLDHCFRVLLTVEAEDHEQRKDAKEQAEAMRSKGV